MYLTTENTKEYLGRSLDSHKRRFHYYPLIVKQWTDGRYYYVDRTETAMPVPGPEDRFNSVYFDIVR